MPKKFLPVVTFGKISIRRAFRDKTAMFFIFMFPLIFLFVFGGIFGKNNGVIWDKKLFKYVENNISKPSNKYYKKLVMSGALDKIKISEKDPDEHGLRKVINYGHTVGHALEAASNHRISHGEGVALGMQAEAFISCSLGIMKKIDMQRQNDLIAQLGIKPKITSTDEQLISIMRRDKKSKGGKLYFVLPSSIGSVHRSGKDYAFEASEAVVKKSLAYLRARL